MGWELQEYIFICIIKKERERETRTDGSGWTVWVSRSFSFLIHIEQWCRTMHIFRPGASVPLLCVRPRAQVIHHGGTRRAYFIRDIITLPTTTTHYTTWTSYSIQSIFVFQVCFFFIYLSIFFLFSNGWKGFWRFARSYRKNKVDSKARNNTRRNE